MTSSFKLFSQMTSQRGKNIGDTLGCASCATFLFLPHFDVICNLLLNRRTATWNLFVKCNHLDKSGHLGSMFRFLCILPCKCNCMSRQCYCTQRSHHTDCGRPNIHWYLKRCRKWIYEDFSCRLVVIRKIGEQNNYRRSNLYYKINDNK